VCEVEDVGGRKERRNKRWWYKPLICVTILFVRLKLGQDSSAESDGDRIRQIAELSQRSSEGQ
jgi:hypothetical protein